MSVRQIRALIASLTLPDPSSPQSMFPLLTDIVGEPSVRRTEIRQTDIVGEPTSGECFPILYTSKIAMDSDGRLVLSLARKFYFIDRVF